MQPYFMTHFQKQKYFKYEVLQYDKTLGLSRSNKYFQNDLRFQIADRS